MISAYIYFNRGRLRLSEVSYVPVLAVSCKLLLTPDMLSAPIWLSIQYLIDIYRSDEGF